MEVTINSKFMSKEILEKRKQMIEHEKLHIRDKLSKRGFKNLHKKYGLGFDERDFAWAFLDIDELRYYNLDTEKSAETTILSYEYVSNMEFKNIRDQLIEQYNLKHGEKKTSEEIFDMYDKFSGRLSMKLFLEEILGIRGSIIKNFKKGDIKNGKINFDVNPGEYNTIHNSETEIPMHVLDPNYIHELRRKLFLEAGLRVGDSILYEQIQALNKGFCPNLPEMVFAEKAIGISANSYNGLKSTKSKKPTNGLVFQDIIIPNEYFNEIANKIAILHKLESGQLLNREDFNTYYDKYGGILSRKIFALSVLEMTDKGYSDAIENKVAKSATILKSKDKVDLNVLSKRIVVERCLHHGDILRYETFKEIHKQYDPNISEFIFAEKVFGIKSPSLQNMKYNNGYSRINLKLPSKEEFKALQKKVILENGIHIYDKLDYKEVERLYGIYGGILPIKMFAIEVLGIEKQSFIRIKRDEKNKAYALFNLEILRSELDKIKQEIIIEAKLQKPRELTIKEIERIYDVYGGIMPQNMFLKQILGINIESFNHLKDTKQEKTMACVRMDFSEKEVEELKGYIAEGLTDAKIAIRMGVTTTFLRTNIKHLIEDNKLTEHSILYEKVKLLSNQGYSPEEIQEELEINEGNIKDIFILLEKEEIQEKKEEEKKKILENMEQKKKKEIEKRARKVIDNYKYNDKSIKAVRDYIGQCNKSFKIGKFERKDLDFLMECMLFVQCNCKEIELFSRICIFFKEYKMASSFIMENIDNEDVNPEERVKLIKSKESIDYIIKKQQAIKLLKMSEMSPNKIAKVTGIPEIDVIQFKKDLDERSVNIIAVENNNSIEVQSDCR